jgi:hypothetical protein
MRQILSVFCYELLPAPPATIAILAIMLLAIYVTSGAIQHLIEAPAFLTIQLTIVEA